MDWFTWLSKTNLETSLVYEYGIAFANNELDEEDIPYFNHEFLQSMGISIAKHRLEILKLATKHHKNTHTISKILLVFKKTKKSFASYISTLIHHHKDKDSKNNDRALVIVPNQNKHYPGALKGSQRWLGDGDINNNSSSSMKYSKQEILMITNGDYMSDNNDHMVVSSPKLDSYSSPLMYDHLQQCKDEKIFDDDHVGDHNWSPTLEEVRWDAMFQDLKPT